MEVYPAHIRTEIQDGRSVDVVQTVEEHCRSAAEYAAGVLSDVNLEEVAYLSGLLHDCGKFTMRFSKYIWEAHKGKDVCRGSVNHTFAGCRLLLEHFHECGSFRGVSSELLAYAVGAHHGLFDCIDENSKSGFEHRMTKQNIDYQESITNFLKYCADWPELERRFEKANRQLEPIYQKLTLLAKKNQDETGEELYFGIGQLARLLLSAVIEGDRRDTAEFMMNIQQKDEEKASRFMWEERLEYMENKLLEFPQDTEIRQARSQISNLCRQAAERPEGIYRLNVPTGGGKTLSSLRYALAHAEKWGKQRIVFVTPLLTILEQNASVIREYVGDDSIILEHHSNVVDTKETAKAKTFLCAVCYI